jgi:hypothetical protein
MMLKVSVVKAIAKGQEIVSWINAGEDGYRFSGFQVTRVIVWGRRRPDMITLSQAKNEPKAAISQKEENFGRARWMAAIVLALSNSRRMGMVVSIEAWLKHLAWG